MVCLGRGAAIGFYQGDPLKLMEDIAVLRPTIFISVPRIYNRVYDKIMAGISASPVKKALFDFAYGIKYKAFKETGAVAHPFWDGLLFNKIRMALGGRVRMMITGSAPISPDVLNFLRLCFSCHVIEGYGQTEGCGLVCDDGESGKKRES
jgi:long-chain acyl-CoA synthetase